MEPKTKIRLLIRGLQYPPGVKIKEENAVETVQTVEAEFYRKNESVYLFYEEEQEGVPGKLDTRVKCKRDYVELCRRARTGNHPSVNSMVFETGKTYCMNYSTPYGVIPMEIETFEIIPEPKKTDSAWDGIRICYAINSAGERMGLYELSLIPQV